MNKYFLYIISAVVLFISSCSRFNDTEEKIIVELASTSKEYIVQRSGGDCLVPVYSNGRVNVRFLVEKPEWISLDTYSFDGDKTLNFLVDVNPSFSRSVSLELSLNDGKLKDTLTIKQEGTIEYLRCPKPYSSTDGINDSVVEFDLETNLENQAFEYSYEFSDPTGGWISSSVIENKKLKVSLIANPTTISRRVKCTVKYINGWEEEQTMDVFIAQSDNTGEIGTAISAITVHALASETGTLVEDDLTLTGIIISDCDSPNMELNPSLDYNLVDTLASARTAYFQTLDASFGFRLQFDSADENTLKFGTKMKLNLNGTRVYKELNPTRYTISGLNGFNLWDVDANNIVPEKRKTIGELVDSDIYTYVTLSDTEFAFKKGCYLDIREPNNTDWSANLPSKTSSYSDTMDGWATLLIDKDGSGIYAPINIKCPWRRSGNGLPQGAGDTKGIIVHNEMPRLGDAGRYQIRVVDEDGFKQEQYSNYQTHATWYESYNNINTYRVINAKYSYNKLATIIPSTDIISSGNILANGEISTENTVGRPTDNTPYTTSAYYIKHSLSSASDDGNIGNVGLGFIQMAHDWYQWDENNKVKNYNAFVFDFNNLSGTNASKYIFTFDFAGGWKSAGAARIYPAHWCLEYSVDAGNSWILVKKNIKSEKEFVHMRSLPWPKVFMNGQWFCTAKETGMGFSQHAFALPEELCGLDSFKLRLRPYDDVIAALPLQWDGDTEGSRIEFNTNLDLRIRFGSISLIYK